MPIKLLPPRLANQIAAGEVVERPASVVKELVENSLDAGATRIELDIEKGGHKRIRLRDNGSGIAKDELELALSRHATSKIATLDDLEQILSLGFRGEALASISSVSRLSLTSKPNSQEQAWQANCEGRDMAVTLQPAAHPDGTTIDVVDIFYNTPARRKFLRTEKTEYQHIEEVIKRIALSRPDVAFVLRHNGKMTKRFNAVGQDQLAMRVGQVCGQSFLQQALHTRCDYDGITLEAWLGDASQMRSSNDCQYSFVNGRGMRDKLILHALRQAYESVLASAEQPAFVVYLTIDPREVDVNVHPAKHEVRFQQSRLVHDFICKAVCDALVSTEEYQSSLSGVTSDEPSHDYIRPLAQRTTSDYPQDDMAPAQVRSAPAAASSSRGQYTPPATRGVSGRYQQHYQALMTPTTEAGTAQANALSFVTLLQQRLYSLPQQCILLDAGGLWQPWLTARLAASSVAQPLLMPVAVNQPLVAESLALLSSAGFEVSLAGGKSRLLKVPGGLRQLPWAALFPEMIAASPQSQNALLSALGKALLVQQADPAPLWQWFDELAVSAQTDILEQHGFSVAPQDVIHWIKENNNK
ncbi:DNA mismatch repair endonuclease MutL [Alteromonas lipolytica]|uniref:DNA mismatch repair protein MutL n=1 Tax=Alteromonas lipolytica TaxID=1856405 RepID=A0A1E8F870_9ALTE|nr:DNA mismatch repair endonuclease MutL [Alteromonas lipolytica]OFI32119.1 DNA mismatch repair protein MutL [Alteromonas lipolytica]GGF83748.1 DNA mismatch repair protein MutL [Alteromonas lipolytica]